MYSSVAATAIYVLAILITSAAKSPKNPAAEPINERTRCETIRIPFCQEQRYRRATLPNIFNHTQQQDVALDALQFALLLQEKECRPNLVNFLCITYLPPCLGKVNRQNVAALPPCQELCQRAFLKCSAKATLLGNPWPTNFQCDNFPKRKTGQCWKGFRNRKKSNGGRSKSKQILHAPLSLPLTNAAPQSAMKGDSSAALHVESSEDLNNGSGMLEDVYQQIRHSGVVPIGKIHARMDPSFSISSAGASVQRDTPGRQSTSGEVSSKWVVNVKYKGAKDDRDSGGDDSAVHVGRRRMNADDVKSLRLNDRLEGMQSLLDAFQRWINEGRRLNNEFNRKMRWLMMQQK